MKKNLHYYKKKKINYLMIKDSKNSSVFTTYVDNHLPLIESYLKKCISDSFSDSRQILIDAMNHSLLDGGKRIRPLLCLMAQQLFSNDIDKILPLAAATEIIHTYSLIHDDLPCMDNDDFRRGKPTCHVKYGEDIAILAGDTLNSLAFEILITQCQCSPDNLIELLKYFSKALGSHGLVGGQVLDISSNGNMKNIDYLKYLHSMKTGALIQVCFVCAGILNNATSSQLKLLENFGYHIGLLFQITDDILDVTGNTESLGKSPFKDQEMNKLTYVSLLGLSDAKKAAEAESKKAIAILNTLPWEAKAILKNMIQFILKRTY